MVQAVEVSSGMFWSSEVCPGRVSQSRQVMSRWRVLSQVVLVAVQVARVMSSYCESRLWQVYARVGLSLIQNQL